MKKLILIIALILGACNTFAQLVQFSQIPVSLNPALAGSADAMRISFGGNYHRFQPLPSSNIYYNSALDFSIDKFLPKIKSGVGLYFNESSYKLGLQEGNSLGGLYLKNNNSTEFGIIIAPKFSSNKKSNPQLVKATWSPAFELNYRAIGVQFNSNNYAGNQIDQVKLKASVLGFRLGFSRVGVNSIIGIVYGYNFILSNNSKPILASSYYYPTNSQDSTKENVLNGDISIKEETIQNLGLHYGLTINLNSAKTLAIIPQFMISYSDKVSVNRQSNFGTIGGDKLVFRNITNLRYKKALTGLSFAYDGYYGLRSTLSLGYQSKQFKIIATSDLHTYGELTLGYVFK